MSAVCRDTVTKSIVDIDHCDQVTRAELVKTFMRKKGLNDQLNANTINLALLLMILSLLRLGSSLDGLKNVLGHLN